MTVSYVVYREKEVSLKDYVKSVLVPSSKSVKRPDETRMAAEVDIKYTIYDKENCSVEELGSDDKGRTVRVVKREIESGVPIVIPLINKLKEPFRIDISSPSGTEEITSGVVYMDSYSTACNSLGEPDTRQCRWSFEYQFENKIKSKSYFIGSPDNFPTLVDISKWVLIIHPYCDTEILYFDTTFGLSIPREHDILQPWMLASQPQWSSEIEKLIIEWFDEENDKRGLKTVLYSYNPFRNGTNECFKVPHTLRTSLHSSCSGSLTKGSVRFVKTLLTKCEGISINDKDYMGRTPLHYAAEVVGVVPFGTATATSYQNNISLVELLIKSNADLSICDNDGNTALAIAQNSEGSDGEITTLIKKSSNPTRRCS